MKKFLALAMIASLGLLTACNSGSDTPPAGPGKGLGDKAVGSTPLPDKK